jgi:hypothetical protein
MRVEHLHIAGLAFIQAEASRYRIAQKYDSHPLLHTKPPMPGQENSQSRDR